MSLRILHVAQPLDAGVPRVVADLVADQVRRGWDVTVACPGAGELWDAFQGTAPRLVRWDATRSPGLATIGEVIRIGKIRRSVEPHLVHLHSAKAGLAGRLSVRGGTATIFQPHAWSFEAVDGIIRSLATAWERKAARWTDALICVSRAEAEVGAASGISAPFEVVPNGIDLGRWPEPVAADRAQARAGLGLDPEAPIVVCVGRLSLQKGQDVLLAAWPTVLQRHPRARLYLVGDGPERERLTSGVDPTVTILGDRPDVRTWLLACDLVALPSRWEGMSIAMLEAMATARCVVSSDVPGAAEALAGDAGVLLPKGDAEALGRELARLLDAGSRADSIGQKARARVESDFDIERVRARVAEIYEQVLERRSSYR